MEIPLSRFRNISLDQILPDRHDLTWKDHKIFTWRKKSFFNWNGKSFFSRCRFRFDGRNRAHRMNYAAIEQEVGVEKRSMSNSCPNFFSSKIGLCEKIEKLVLHRRYEPALELFEILCGLGTYDVPGRTYEALVSACIGLKSSKATELVFNQFMKSRIEPDQYLMNRILLMHVKCGMISEARELFGRMRMRNQGSWNTMMIGLVDSGYYREAFQLFLTMWNEFSYGGSFTFTTSIRACAGLGFLILGRQLHTCIVKMNLEENVYVACALLDMYSKCGSIEDAKQIFDEMPEKTTISWNSMIAGYALHGYSEEALDLYNKMQDSGVKSNQITFSIIVKVSARLASMSHAREAHATLIRNGYELDVVAGTALIDCYCKWGRMHDAQYVFDEMRKRNIMTWNALIAGYGAHGLGQEAVRVFYRMIHKRIKPDHITFLAVLSACSRAGLSGPAWELFRLMESGYRVKPRPMHYTCMVELLGREGRVYEAYSFIQHVKSGSTPNMWAGLLTACRIHRNFEMAQLAAEQIYAFQPEKLCNYIVLFNIYNELGRRDKAYNVLETLKRKGLSLLPPCSWIEVNKQACEFIAGEVSSELGRKVEEIWSEIERCGFASGEEEGFLPDVVAREGCSTKWHSEILAIVFGLMMTGEFTALQVVQEHRACGDCHSAIKFISMVNRRDIVLKDASRFHHFTNGKCSCGDYW